MDTDGCLSAFDMFRIERKKKKKQKKAYRASEYHYHMYVCECGYCCCRFFFEERLSYNRKIEQFEIRFDITEVIRSPSEPIAMFSICIKSAVDVFFLVDFSSLKISHTNVQNKHTNNFNHFGMGKQTHAEWK